MSNENELIIKIKQKKELSGISDSIIREYISDYLSKGRITLENLSPSQEKLIVKDIRAKLRRISGMFQLDLKAYRKRTEFLEEDSLKELIASHSSTKERIPNYGMLIDFIKKLKINSILDLGCGLNPIALAPELKGVKYYASDIREDELSLISDFFKKYKIDGETFVFDLRKIDDSLPKADLCLLFKVLESIETEGHLLSEKIISSVKCEYILVSFSTKKLSGKPMNNPERVWLEKMLSRLNFKFRLIKTPNEIFYFIKKN